jgi:hypothetical protein
MRLPYHRGLCLAAAMLALAATGVAGAAGGPGGDDLVACRSKGQVQALKGGWLRIKPFRPDQGEGPRRIVDFAAAPSAPNHLFETNGEVIKLSADGGCTWELVDNGTQLSVPGQAEDAGDVYTALATSGDDRLWAVSYDNVGGVTHPHTHVYDNVGPDSKGDPKHTQPENGLPPVGKPVDFLTSPIDPGANYLLIDEPADPENGRPAATRELYTTYVPDNPPQAGVALGMTWKRVPTPAGLGAIEGFALGSGSRALWIWSATKATMTADAAAADPGWTPPLAAGGAVRGVDVGIDGRALVAVENSQGGAVGRYTDPAGRPVGRETGLPVPPESMAHGALLSATRVLSGRRGTYGFDAHLRRWVDITPPGAGALAGLTMAPGRVARLVLGHTADALYRFDTYGTESFVRVTHYIPPGPPDVHGKYHDPHFEHPSTTVTVQPGQVVDVANQLDVPPDVHKLDVFFLVDTTGSMQPTIDGLRGDVYGIAEQLHKTLGQQACFGVGDVKDVAPTDPLNSYHVRMKIGCETDPKMPRIKAALATLQSGGGGSDAAEAQTVALDELMTGAGQAQPFVLPNEDAEFRRGAYKVVVLITDAPFKQGNGFQTIEDAASALKAGDVRVVNVLVRTNLDPAAAYADMAELARLTDSLAPLGGVDCDADGKIGPGDVREGDPIVCQSDGSNPNIGPLIVTLLLGVEDPGTVAVDVHDPYGVVRPGITTPLAAVMNLKRDAELKFTLPVGCTSAQDGLDLPVQLSATVRAKPVDAHGQILVRCRAVVPRGIPVLPGRPDPPPPPEPPHVVPKLPLVGVALPVPNPPPPASNVNLNAGFSQQEEEQFQVATVSEEAGDNTQDDEVVELAMSRYPRDPGAAPVAAFLGGTAVLSAAVAVAQRRRLQRATRCAPAR